MKKSVEDDELVHLAKSLRIPGMRHLRDIVLRVMDDAIAREQAEMEGRRNGPKRGRPPRDVNQHGQPLKKPGGESWAKLTPEERSQEMKRRQALGKENRRRKETHANMSRAAKQRWASMTKAKQQAHLSKMRAAKANKPSVKLEVAS